MAEQAGLFLFGVWLVARDDSILTVAGVVLIGTVYARNLEFAHECLHGTALRGAFANRVAGVLLGVPMFVSFHRWRVEHARHHADVRVEGFQYRYERLTNWRELVLHVFMVRHFGDAFASMLRALFATPRGFSERTARRVRRDALLQLALVFGCAAVALVLRSWVPVMVWFAPLVVAAVVHTHIELPEHFGLPGGVRDAFVDSRIVRAGAFVRWLVNGNNYHAVHHWNPRLPIARLHEVYGALGDRFARPVTYREFFVAFYTGLAKASQASRSARFS